jgi:polar amino acid transport system substrate-binding protein
VGASPEPTAQASPAPSVPAGSGLLARIQEAGVIRINTDPAYAPQSLLREDGTWEGFDIDVANEVARRLGVTVEFTTVPFDLVQAGSWTDRFDMSVGSITITEDRKQVLDFTQPYYYTPAQMAVTTESGITTLEGLEGQVICVGSGTTYQDWIEGTLQLSEAPPPATPPEGASVFAVETDRQCSDAIASGRTEFVGWLSSSTTVEDAINDGAPVVAVGDPVFYESLAIAFDNTVDDNDALVAAVDQIVADMHSDGTLRSFSEKWFGGLDLTTPQ